MLSAITAHNSKKVLFDNFMIASYWKITVFAAKAPATITPMSIPLALNAAGFAVGSAPTYTAPLDCIKLGRVAGTFAMEIAGTVKLDDPAGATQANTAEEFVGVSTPPPNIMTG